MSRACKATMTKNSSLKPTTKMTLLTDDLRDPTAPKDAPSTLQTEDQIFPLSLAREASSDLTSPEVVSALIPNSNVQDAPKFLIALSQGVNDLIALNPVAAVLTVFQADLILKNLTLLTPTFLMVLPLPKSPLLPIELSQRESDLW